ncbi:glycerol uptake facilitator protein [Clostridium beijerinckii]|uniref:MIP/aquaporin family protein n=1 Tax=Clostridium beijerinckii TaxID=1520 RepID=UPI00156E2E6B|nr:MIP/aquaporin family protein [Clostridium beijerinckii]MBA9013000.1 glycerol uptake facilitator protein [Clostridium beijerinckii]MBC2421321.1 aquaporin family protein [Clostridium beijerinckii]MBC2430525.1 aquaporin family protein [Clostridium beijerinckii]NRT30675.1 glycerol uptake facilitator protein [Clostridium beijerinckii]NRT98283.1 glycerol uptake facilitator protein [Clostridium beijerinckii]
MTIFFAELVGTLLLILLGDGVVANVVLKKSGGSGAGLIVIAIGWAFAVGIPALIFGSYSGAHFNPALTIALAVIGKVAWAQVPIYLAGQCIGAFLGAVLVFIVYNDQFKATEDKGSKLGVFCTGPQVKNTSINFITELVGTFVLVYAILGMGDQNLSNGMGTLFVAFLILAIGVSLGGPTGYAINPARDLMPRIEHAVLPIPDKGDSNWGYAWIPVVAPIVGGTLAALFYVMLHGIL